DLKFRREIPHPDSAQADPADFAKPREDRSQLPKAMLNGSRKKQRVWPRDSFDDLLFSLQTRSELENLTIAFEPRLLDALGPSVKPLFLKAIVGGDEAVLITDVGGDKGDLEQRGFYSLRSPCERRSRHPAVGRPVSMR